MPAITISKRTVDAARPGARISSCGTDRSEGFRAQGHAGRRQGLPRASTAPAAAARRPSASRSGGTARPGRQIRHERKAKAILGAVAAGGDPAAEKRADARSQRSASMMAADRSRPSATRWFSTAPRRQALGGRSRAILQAPRLPRAWRPPDRDDRQGRRARSSMSDWPTPVMRRWGISYAAT